MATSPNFSWPEPDNTDLVKNGALAIRTAVDAIDSSMADLKGGTSGQVLSKASNTDMDFTWVAQDDSNAIQNALLTTTGDTIYASSASTPARLGIGSTGQVLTVSGGVPTWATPSAGGAGLTLVKSQTIGSAVSSVTVTGAFSSTYDNYYITVTGGAASANLNLRLTLGSTTSGYYANGYYMTYASATVNGFNDNGIAFFSGGQGTANGLMMGLDVQSPNLATRTVLLSDSVQAASGGYIQSTWGYLDNNTQYTAFTLTTGSGTITGGTIRVYGYQNS